MSGQQPVIASGTMGNWLTQVVKKSSEANWLDEEVIEELLDAGNLAGLIALFDANGITYYYPEFPTGKKVLVFEYGTLWVVEPGNSYWREPDEWLEDAHERPEEFYGERDESAEFWEGVGPGFYLYHATLDEYVQPILQNGLEARNVIRGLDNRGMGAAVFTVSDSNIDDLSAVLDSYGSSIIRIDVGAMKADGYMPQIGGETPIEEAEMKGSLAHGIGYDDYEPYGDVSSDYMNDTIVIYGDIPPKYLSVL